MWQIKSGERMGDRRRKRAREQKRRGFRRRKLTLHRISDMQTHALVLMDTINRRQLIEPRSTTIFTAK
jgi:hypothetical protein